jgi:hypothetical protein
VRELPSSPQARTSAASALVQGPVVGEVGEQEMEVDEPGERLPVAHSALNTGVVERLESVVVRRSAIDDEKGES